MKYQLHMSGGTPPPPIPPSRAPDKLPPLPGDNEKLPEEAG